jgi:hypothetical protein
MRECDKPQQKTEPEKYAELQAKLYLNPIYSLIDTINSSVDLHGPILLDTSQGAFRQETGSWYTSYTLQAEADSVCRRLVIKVGESQYVSSHPHRTFSAEAQIQIKSAIREFFTEGTHQKRIVSIPPKKS